jgi:cardiolipin synthase
MIERVFVASKLRKVSMLSAILFLCTGGCSSNPHLQGVPPEEVQINVEEAPDLIRRFDEPIQLSAAYFDGESLSIRYEAEGKSYYGYSDHTAKENLSIHTDWLPVYYIHEAGAEKFAEKSASADALPILGADHWQRLRAYVAEEIVPAEPGEGVLVNLRDEAYFLYRDEEHVLRNPGLLEKPADVPLTGVYRVESMGESLAQHMESYFDQIGVSDQKVLISTGESGPYARPFVLVDRRTGTVEFGSLEPFTFGSMPNSYAVKGGKAGWHLFRSNIFEVLNRPVSYVGRFFWLATDVVRDSTRGTYIRSFSFRGLDKLDIPPLHDGEGMDLEAWEESLDRLYGKSQSSGEIDLLMDGDEFFPVLLDAVISARRSVKMRTYIFDRDDYAIDISDLLRKRSVEIDVQVMLDGLGTIMAQNKAAGTMPPDHQAPVGITTHLKEGSRVRVRSLTNPWFSGDHTKTTIVDGERAFIGGMNIGREYRWEWHDVMMEVRGPIVDLIEWEFDKAWAHGAVGGDFVLTAYRLGNPRPKNEAKGYPIRMLRTRPSSSEIYQAQLRAVRNSKTFIYIQNAYFSDTTMIYELAKARLRGVDVRVIIPMEGNHGIMNKNNVAAANTLLKYGVRVFTYPGMSHIKAAVYDGWMCLGSANFDKLSFRINKEMNLASSQPEIVQEIIEKIFTPDFADSVELTKPLPSGWGNTFASILASQL